MGFALLILIGAALLLLLASRVGHSNRNRFSITRCEPGSNPPSTTDTESILGIRSHQASPENQGPQEASGGYYSLLQQIQVSEREGDLRQALRACEESLALLGDFVETEKREYGSFVIQSIPAIEIGARYWAA